MILVKGQGGKTYNRRSEDHVANYFQYSDAEWDRGKAKMTAILQAVAARRGMIAYSDLSNLMTTLRIEAFGLPMSEMLGEIAEAVDDAGRGLLTVIVVHKAGDQEPGDGFYEMAEKRGRNVSDRMTLWVTEFKKVHDYWANRA